jgi:glucan phosphoethanolaminetransferase (alkaline phosphatase superfamily)
MAVLDAAWMVVAIVVAVIFFVVALVQKRQSMATGVVKTVSVFLVLSVGYIFIANHVQLDSMSSIIEGFKIYMSWLGSAFDKAIDVTSYAVKQNWTANSTLGK